MMTSNLLSRLLPSNPGGRSIYDDLRAHDEEDDIEEQAGLALDEANLRYRDEDLDHEAFNGDDSRMTSASTAFLSHVRNRSPERSEVPRDVDGTGSKWLPQSPRLLEEEDDDVPGSLLVEGNDIVGPSGTTRPRVRTAPAPKRHSAIPGPSSRENRAHWEAVQAQQQLHQENRNKSRGQMPEQPKSRLLGGSAREKAMWRWNSVINIDHFMHEVYDYYKGSGMWCILTERILSILTQIFVVSFGVLLTNCIDYTLLYSEKNLSDVLIPKCTTRMPGIVNLGIWLFTLYLFVQIYTLVFVSLPSLLRTRSFFEHLLEVPEKDMQTITWQDVVARIMAMRDANPGLSDKMTAKTQRFIGRNSKERLDAHDIANRLMRRENYFIAMFNKNILDLTLPIPFLKGRPLFSRHLMSILDLTIMDFMFNESGQVSQLVLKDSKRRELSEGLRKRFVITGLGTMITAWPTALYYSAVFFFKYFNEYKKSPSSIGQRQYTQLAEWKFREFNELEHMFHNRLNMSYPFATRYLSLFPKRKTEHVSRFATVVLGAIIVVLTLPSIHDPEHFLTFDLFPKINVALAITVLGVAWNIFSGSIPEDHGVFIPEYAMLQVMDYTHYKPPHWNNRLHSDEVMLEFSSLYNLRIVQFAQEVLCILAIPLILTFSLPACSDQIIDFFREFTIHVDGVGYVCSFAVFDFKRGDGRTVSQNPNKSGVDPREDYYSTKEGKMTASYYNFVDNYSSNPKTGISGYTGRANFNPPPSFPGLMSPTMGGGIGGMGIESSRMGRSEIRRGPRGYDPRTPRFAATGAGQFNSPMASMLLDPLHQPGRSIHHPRHKLRNNITEEAAEEDDDAGLKDERGRGTIPKKGSLARDPYESTMGGLGESHWELSPTRGKGIEEEDEEEQPGGAGGVLGMLYQFQKAQTGVAGVNI